MIDLSFVVLVGAVEMWRTKEGKRNSPGYEAARRAMVTCGHVEAPHSPHAIVRESGIETEGGRIERSHWK